MVCIVAFDGQSHHACGMNFLHGLHEAHCIGLFAEETEQSADYEIHSSSLRSDARKLPFLPKNSS
jgi:hypothetical protein